MSIIDIILQTAMRPCSCRYFWFTQIQVRSGGIIEAQLRIAKTKVENFRPYTLVAVNDLGTRIANVSLDQSMFPCTVV